MAFLIGAFFVWSVIAWLNTGYFLAGPMFLWLVLSDAIARPFRRRRADVTSASEPPR